MKFVKWLSVTDRYTHMYLDRMFAHLGINSSQHMYICEICEHPGITQDQFINLFHIHPSNVTRSIAALEKIGYIEKKQNQQDKRTCMLYPTQKAYVAAEEINTILAQWEEELLGEFSKEERETFQKMLYKIGEKAVKKN